MTIQFNMSPNAFVFIAILAIIPCFFVTSDACSCAPPELRKRNVGCKDEFMAVVNITGVLVHDMHREYTFTLIEDFTPLLVDKRSVSQFESITTGIYEAVCGITLPVNAVYLMKGHLNKEPHIALCDAYIKVLTHVPTAEERKVLFAELYKHAC